MGATAILTIYPATLFTTVLAVGNFTSSTSEVYALLFVVLLAFAGLIGLITMSRQSRSAGDP